MLVASSNKIDFDHMGVHLLEICVPSRILSFSDKITIDYAQIEKDR